MSSYALLFLNTLGTHFALQHPMITDVARDLKKNLLNTFLKVFLKSFTTDKVFTPCVKMILTTKICFYVAGFFTLTSHLMEHESGNKGISFNVKLDINYSNCIH